MEHFISRHNMHHYFMFFESIRNCIAGDKLPELIQLVEGCVREETVAKEDKKIPPILEQVEPASVAT